MVGVTKMKGLKYFFVFLLVLGAATGGYLVSRKSLLSSPPELLTSKENQVSKATATTTPKPEKTLGNFSFTNQPSLIENGKPAVYFYGTSTCPHCQWEKPIAQKVFARFKDQITYHEIINPKSNEDFNIFRQFQSYNPDGGVPFLILGGRYVRVGSGQNLGTSDEESKKLEEEALTALVCELTDSQPGSVCEPLKEKISQIK